MDIQNITGNDAIPRGTLETSKEYVKSVTTEKADQSTLEKIREEGKGNKIDTTV